VSSQPGISQEVPSLARYLFFSLTHQASQEAINEALLSVVDGDSVVVGLGKPFLDLGRNSVAGLKDPVVYSGSGVSIPAVSYALWFWLRGDDRGNLVGLTLRIEEALGENVQLEDVVDSFKFDVGRDLSGYIDGTENPEGDEAVAAGFVTEGPLAGSSFVAVQKWLHDLVTFRQLPHTDQDDIFGRRVVDNEEYEEAPESAHVKRAAQESFSPEAFMLRRSMPWADFSGEGLVFVAFGNSYYAFDAVMKQMLGVNDGVTDGLFEFSRCLGTGYYWCPPIVDGKLDLSAIS
jgi:putative iron-dependent peroxidase